MAEPMWSCGVIPPMAPVPALLPGPMPAFDWNPLDWLGNAAGAMAGTAWQQAMTALWSVGLWLMGFALRLGDALSTPDLDPRNGVIAAILPITGAIAASLAGLVALGQLVLALARRSGESLAALTFGVVKYAVATTSVISYRLAVVVGAGEVTAAVLHAGLNVSTFGAWTSTAGFPRHVTDAVLATALGLFTPSLIVPTAFANVTVALTRSAALLVMMATAPITTAGLLGEGTSSWFWKENRWFHAAALTPVLQAIVLAVGVQLTKAVVSGAGDSAAAVGTVLVSVVLFLLAAVCPLALFRLLAFVDPGTTSGANFRAALGANQTLKALLTGSRGSASPAARTSQGGQSAGEAAASASHPGRLAGAMSALAAKTPAGAASFAAAAAPRLLTAASALGMAHRIGMAVTDAAITHGSDVLNMTGVGHQQHYYGDQRPLRGKPDPSAGRGGASDRSGGAPGAAPPPPPPPPPPSADSNFGSGLSCSRFLIIASSCSTIRTCSACVGTPVLLAVRSSFTWSIEFLMSRFAQM